MSAEQLFKRLLKELRPTVAVQAFVRRSQNFVCETPECFGIINFQKSRWSSEGEKSFTINLAIASKRILAYRGKPADVPPREWAAHWRIRIGELMPDHRDKWWTLTDEDSYSSVKNEVEEAVVVLAAPLLKLNLSEDSLFELWDSKMPGNSDYPRLKDKSILLAERNRFEELPQIFERIREICRGTLAEEGAEDHISVLKRRFGLNG